MLVIHVQQINITHNPSKFVTESKVLFVLVVFLFFFPFFKLIISFKTCMYQIY